MAKRSHTKWCGTSSRVSWRRPALPLLRRSSTLGAGGLNDRVRDGNGCFPPAIATRNIPILDFGLWILDGSGTVNGHRAFACVANPKSKIQNPILVDTFKTADR